MQAALQINFNPPKGLTLLHRFITLGGGDFWIVGGFVRELMLNQTMSLDIDIATNLTTDQVLQILTSLDTKNKVANIEKSGEKFGSISCTCLDLKFDITTLRRDVKNFGRKAEVEFTADIEEDSRRRDFTFNALYMDLSGKVYDFHNGINDLRLGRVVFIGSPSQRIQEDYLRIIRYYRFNSYLSGTFDETVVSAMQTYYVGITRYVSIERIVGEMQKIFFGPYGYQTIQKMHNEGLLSLLLQYKSHFDLESLRLKMPLVNKEFSFLIWATMLSCMEPQEATSLLQKLPLKRNHRVSIGFSLKHNILNCQELTLDLKMALASAKCDNLPKLVQINPKCRLEMLKFLSSFIPLPITGHDIIKQNPSIAHKDIGAKLHTALAKWIKSDYQCSKKLLLKN